MEQRDENASIHTCLLRIRGVVQGVGFRDACMRHAQVQGIAGWVRNRRDGSVEAMLQGPPAQVAQMCEWLRHGVPGARVAAIEQTTVPAPSPPLQGFDVLPTA